MRVIDHGDYVTLYADGAEVDALYRAYLAEYGPRDGATRDMLKAALSRTDVAEELDGDDCLSVATAVERIGLMRGARQLRAFQASMRASELRWEADCLEAEADRIERLA